MDSVHQLQPCEPSSKLPKSNSIRQSLLHQASEIKMASTTLSEIRKSLREVANPEIAAHSQRFFKTGPGEYGENDQFIGIRVPVLRKFAKQFKELSLPNTEKLLQSKIHEERLLALIILVNHFAKANDEPSRKRVYDCYDRNLRFVNNWDLVDSSAHLIAGPYLQEKSRKQLYRWAKSNVLWERRIAIMATLAYIKEHDFEDTLKLAEILLEDKEDLIQKSVGWMLREIGNRDLAVEEAFLKKHYLAMPRTMLRYAIEKFPEPLRKKYLQSKV